MDEFTNIVPSAFRPFIGYHQGLLACIKSVFKEFGKCELFIEKQSRHYSISVLMRHHQDCEG